MRPSPVLSAATFSGNGVGGTDGLSLAGVIDEPVSGIVRGDAINWAIGRQRRPSIW